MLNCIAEDVRELRRRVAAAASAIGGKTKRPELGFER